MVKETLKTLLLKGIKDEFFEPLSLIGASDVSHLPYDDFRKLCISYSRGISNISKNSRELSSQFFESTTKIGATKSFLNSQLDDLHEEQK